ncbi:EAL domain-containing protein [Micromonospora pattaloongensis]|uniref:EAL domain-containing protein n=1 Tax=Micromonospora pattaloongensis TaxID=405436 RepID=UPI001C313CF0|nr:EAL domain-containing protein [Micromonospora pattaloongensis]
MSATSPAGAVDDRPDADPDWSAALRRVLADGNQPALVAQPIVDLGSGAVAGFELLSRFPADPAATPDRWFAAADRLGFAPDLTARVVQRALALRPELPSNTFITINAEPHLVPHPAVRDALLGAGRLDRVVIELTEHVRASDDAALRAVLDQIREQGGLIAVDDAGTGYSGLEQLMSVRPDIVKLDRALVTGIDHDPVRRSMVELMGELASRMDGWLLAEGVETEGELRSLASLGVPLVQGWLLGRPATGWPSLAGAVTELLRDCMLRVSLTEHIIHLVRDCDIVTEPPGPAVPSTARTRATAVLVDPEGRPRSVLVPGPDSVAYVVPAMTVAPSSAPHDVARRALARPAWQRGAPLVCTDASGHVLGVLDVGELVDAAMAAASR